ncbi:MAG: T9SS type A sorting domain-containing protein [Kordia sp.]|uniref:T9SS type A sorting domain-containing protein n=1 Tax=Kordia sp. TaxID=1965332 RepID=UPI00385D8C34
MKKNYTCICMAVCLLMSFTIAAQEVVDVATTGLLNPVGIAKNGNDLFISSVGNASIQRKDLLDTSSTATTEYIQPVNFPTFIAFNGNDLYIPLLGTTDNKVVKIDVTDPNAVLTDVVTNITTPMGLAFRNNELYISLRQEAKVIKVDVTQNNPTPVDVVTLIPGGLVNGIAFRGDELYITHGNSISKVNVTDSTPVLAPVLILEDGIAFIAFHGDFMYFTQSSINTVARVDITQSIFTIDNFLVLEDDPWGLLVDGNDLYIAQQFGGSVVRFDLTTLLSVNEASARKFTYYPNPTKDYLHIAGLENNTPFTLTDQHGKEIIKGRVNASDKIDLSAVANGIYFLRLNNYEIKKIVKY